MAEIVFHSSLVAEMQAIQAIRDLTAASEANAGQRGAAPQAEANSFRQARFHRIGPPPDDLLGAGSSGDRSPRNLTALWDAGRSGGRTFLLREGRQLGVQETLDLKAAFIDQRKTRLPPPARTEAARQPGHAQPGLDRQGLDQQGLDQQGLARPGLSQPEPVKPQPVQPQTQA